MMKKLILAFGMLSGTLLSAQVVVNDTFYFTGSMQTFTVPTCVTSVTITAYGSRGMYPRNNNPYGGGSPGLGGMASGVLNVTTGQTLNIFVGDTSGYNGGGTGGMNGNDQFSGQPLGLGANGGGASDVRIGGTALTDRVIVAGGGGGAGNGGVWPGCQVSQPAGNGGAGGGLTGGNGTFGVGTPCNCGGGGGGGGTGGSQAAGGTHGTYAGSSNCLRGSWTAGQDGTLGQGGAGATSYYNGSGGAGGGGGGYYGGGAGGNGSDTTPGGGGGGGSSWTGTLSSATTTAGVRNGNGMIIISYSNIGSVPAAPTNYTGPAAVCPATIVTYSIDSVVGATSYNWTVPPTWTILSGQGTTTVSFVVDFTSDTIWANAINSCGNGPASYAIITVHPLPTLELGLDTANCGPVVLTADPAVSYAWSNGYTTQSTTATTSGTYSVTITDANGCTNSDYLYVTVNSNPTVTASAPMYTVCAADDTVQLAGSPAGGVFTGTGVVAGTQFDPVTAGVGTHVITYSYTDVNGCSGMDTLTMTVDVCTGVTTAANNEFSFYPNPASGAFVILFRHASGPVTITITDVQGRIIHTQQESVTNDGTAVRVPVQNIAAGTYLLNVSSANSNTSQALIIK